MTRDPPRCWRKATTSLGRVALVCLFAAVPRAALAWKNSSGGTHENLASEALRTLTVPFSSNDKTQIKYGANQEDEPFLSFPFRHHGYNPITGQPFDSPIHTDELTALVRASNQWAIMAPNLANGNRTVGFEYLGRVLHLLQDMACPPHTHAPEGHGGIFDDGYESDLEIYAEYLSVAHTDGISMPSSAIPSQPAWGSQMDQSTWDKMRERIGSTRPESLADYMTVMALISYFHNAFYGNLLASNPPLSNNSDPMSLMWRDRIEYHSFGNWWSIQGVGEYENEATLDDWWPMQGQLGTIVYSDKSAKGYFYFYTTYNEEHDRHLQGTAIPTRWPNGNSNGNDDTLAEYLSEVLHPVCIPYSRGLVLYANCEITLKCIPASTGVAVNVRDNFGNQNGTADTTGFKRYFVANTEVRLTASSNDTNLRPFEKWLKDGALFSSSRDPNITVNGTATYTAVYKPSIWGYVKTSGGTPISGVTISGLAGNPQTDSQGYYCVSEPYGFSGTATPSKTGYTFSPANRNYSNITTDERDQNYTGSPVQSTFSISGRVTDSATGAGVSGVTISFSGGYNNVTTDGSGNYSQSGFPNGTYTVTPSKSGYTFNPSSRSVTVSNADKTGQDFTGTAQPNTYSISGRVTESSTGAGISGVAIAFSGGHGAVTSDGSGNYGQSGFPNGTYMVTPSKTGYTFNPVNRSVAISGADRTGQDFTGTPPVNTYSISGRVLDSTTGAGISSVTISFSGGYSSVTTDTSGNYSQSGFVNGTYGVTPSKTGYTFNPGNRSVTVSGVNKTGQDFAGIGVPCGDGSCNNGETCGDCPQDCGNCSDDSFSIVAWGTNDYGECNVPEPNSGFVGVAAGGDHSLGLKTDGSIVAWGYNDNGQYNVPAPNTGFTAVAAGANYSLALKENGSIVAWGDNACGQCEVPEPNSGFVAIAAGALHSLGLKQDSSIVTWGCNCDNQGCNVPAPNTGFTAVEAGGGHSLGLRENGSIVAWGYNDNGECNVPAPNRDFTAVAANANSLGLKENGSIVAWGDNAYGQCDVPEPNAGFVAVAAGGLHSLGLKAGGSIVAWGENYYGQCSVPSPNTGFTGVAAGARHSLGLRAGTQAETGSLRVTIGPQGAIDAGARWLRTGTSDWRASGSTESHVPVGSHTVEFTDISGWSKPSNKSMTVSSGQTTSVFGEYTQATQTGSLRVTIVPQGVIDAGAQWRRTGTSTWQSSGYTESDVPVGSHTVEFKDISGWSKPSNKSVTVSGGQITTVTSNLYMPKNDDTIGTLCGGGMVEAMMISLAGLTLMRVRRGRGGLGALRKNRG